MEALADEIAEIQVASLDTAKLVIGLLQRAERIGADAGGCSAYANHSDADRGEVARGQEAEQRLVSEIRRLTDAFEERKRQEVAARLRAYAEPLPGIDLQLA